MSYEIFERRCRIGGRAKMLWLLWWEVHDKAHYKVVASCPTRDAAEAARRLLSGECARAKEPEPPVCGVCLDTQTRSDGHMCTACPVPCDKCRDGNRPYCRETRCDCDCHERRGRAMGEVVRTVRWPEWVPSSECLRRYNEGKADAQIDRLVAAKTGEGKPMCRSCERGRPHYEDGLADGAAQERAKIVKWLRARHPWVTMANMAGRIERGEAGE